MLILGDYFGPPKAKAISMRRLVVPIAMLIVLMLVTPAAGNSAGVARQQPNLYDCESGPGYTDFDVDSPLVDQVCPAVSNNYSTTGMQTSGALFIVIHNTGNSADNVIQGNINQFQNPAREVSAQYIVGLSEDRSTVHVIQLVREDQVAYHAGGVYNRQIDGKTIDNTNSIGIEVVGIGDLEGWPKEAVYRKVADLVLDIVARARQKGRTIEVTRDYIVGHEEINKGAKSDPGQQWNWQDFMVDYLGGTYQPAMEMKASLNARDRTVALQLVARANGREQLHFERRRDDGEYGKVLKPLADVSRKWQDNPATINLQSDQLPEVSIPTQFCYRAWATLKSLDYVNPSRDGCVQLGTVDAFLVSVDEHLVLKPGETIDYEAELQNTGILPWSPDVPYGVREVDGDRLSTTQWATLSKSVAPGECVQIVLRIVAPRVPGDYHASWQMGYVEPGTGDFIVFGTIIPIDLTVRPKSLGDLGSELGQLISDFIHNLGQSLEQTVQDLLHQVETAVTQFVNDLWARLRQELARAVPCLFTPALVGYTGLALSQRRRRLK